MRQPGNHSRSKQGKIYVGGLQYGVRTCHSVPVNSAPERHHNDIDPKHRYPLQAAHGAGDQDCAIVTVAHGNDIATKDTRPAPWTAETVQRDTQCAERRIWNFITHLCGCESSSPSEGWRVVAVVRPLYHYAFGYSHGRLLAGKGFLTGGGFRVGTKRRFCGSGDFA